MSRVKIFVDVVNVELGLVPDTALHPVTLALEGIIAILQRDGQLVSQNIVEKYRRKTNSAAY